MTIQSNHSFCVAWALQQQPRPQVLDYGCGGATIVSALRAQAVEAYGCDVYYDGGDLSQQVPSELFDQGVVRRMVAKTIPFEDESFDLVINNTVLEHVEDLEATLAEMTRVLKPGGKVLSLFPHREAWLEWHVGLPFIHRFDRGSAWRLHWARALRALGFGFHKGDKPVAAWARDAIDWVDRWTHYRPRVEIDRAFSRHLSAPTRLEPHWLEHKFGGAPLVRRLPSRVKQTAVTLLSGLVFECHKPLGQAAQAAGPRGVMKE